MYYQRSALDGAAWTTIKDIESPLENYELAWNSLRQDTYSSCERIFGFENIEKEAEFC